MKKRAKRVAKGGGRRRMRLVLATGTLVPRSKHDQDGAAIGYAFERGEDGVIRLAMRIDPATPLSRAAWSTVWSMLRADFKSLTEMGTRRGLSAKRRRLRFRKRRRWRRHPLPGMLHPNPRKKKAAPAADAPPLPPDPSQDAIAIAKAVLAKAKGKGR